MSAPECASATHQTVRLGRGRHESPEQGACVMELASMLAGESFSDHPRSVSPTIAGFLRAYNDVLDDRRRQDLYGYAAKVVGTRAPRAIERQRALRVADWASGASGSGSRFLRWLSTRAILWPLRPGPEQVGAAAARGLRSTADARHSEALHLVDELVAMGKRHQPVEATEASQVPVEAAVQVPSPTPTD